MRNLLIKEFKLATPLLTYLFIGFAVMTFIPGYPILCGAFFMCLGMFQGYQYSREAGDMDYSILLPVKKTDIVKAKFASAIILEAAAFCLFAVFTLIRMSFMSETAVYVQNVMMPSNFVFLGFVLLIFAIFNVVFIGGYFKTAYGIGKQFICFIVICFAVITAAEALHHIPGMEWAGALGYEHIGMQLAALVCGVIAFVLLTATACSKAKKRFENLDL